MPNYLTVPVYTRLPSIRLQAEPTDIDYTMDFHESTEDTQMTEKRARLVRFEMKGRRHVTTPFSSVTDRPRPRAKSPMAQSARGRLFPARAQPLRLLTRHLSDQGSTVPAPEDVTDPPFWSSSTEPSGVVAVSMRRRARSRPDSVLGSAEAWRVEQWGSRG